ncbi:MAG: hypothetical protein NC336_09155 [Clostridium sp.]|nr:hypothetical protein [Clostridium sp.]
MKIALIGYGKMGHMIEEAALKRGHQIVAIIDKENNAEIESDNFRQADVAIEFTSPATAADNCLRALRQGVRVVSGSTGWTDRLGEVETLCGEKPGTAFLWSSNYSIGVNLFFAINRYAARLLAPSGYDPTVREIHHIHKLDHPSGTAISIARQIVDEDPRLSGWTEDAGEAKARGEILIEHEREGEVPGTHIVTWDSDVDTITLEHRAKSRAGFALGAVIAAEWLSKLTGYHTMEEFMDTLMPKI